MRVLIVGCGYVGLPLGAELVRRGHEVFGVRRPLRPSTKLRRSQTKPSVSAEMMAAVREKSQEIERKHWQGVTPIHADITRREDLEKFPGPFDWVINTISSSKGGVEEYRAVYLEGTRHLLGWFSRHPPRQYVYTSSTSVYAQTDGAWVTEESAAEGASETGRVLVETEQLLLDAARQRNFPAVILRVAGIYGPERGHLFQQYIKGEARLAGDGSRLINMVHRDDVVRAIIAALERGRASEIYNVTDDEPVTQREFFDWLSGELHMPFPPSEPENTARKRGLTNKRVSNRKLRLELQCELKYPDFRQGYAAEIARLRAAGRWPSGIGN
jgi:nucleoside-diphosphate-sugar epimerase